MDKIFPPTLSHLERWLLEQAQDRAEDLTLDETSKAFSVDDLEIFTEISGLPKDVVIVKTPNQVHYSLLPKAVIQKFADGQGIRHFPIVTPSGLKILDPNGDNVTSLYFSKRILLKMSEARYAMSAEPELAFVSATVNNYEIGAPSKMYYEMLIDDEEVILYRSMAPFRTCQLFDDHLIFKTPGAPPLRVQLSAEKLCEVSYDCARSRRVQGVLISISLQLSPFPYFMLTFADGQCGDVKFEQADIPSFYLFECPEPETNALQRLGKMAVRARVEDIKSQFAKRAAEEQRSSKTKPES